MSEHRYSRRALLADYGRAGAGLLLTLGPMLVINVENKIAYGLGGLALLFLAHGLRTGLRERFAVDVDDRGIRGRGWRETSVAWEDLRRVRLDYFSTRRGRAGGWMQLVIGGGSGTIRIDSGIEGFDTVARRVGRAALARGLELSPATRANLTSLGVALAAEDASG